MEKEQLQKYLHFMMSFIGGFLGAYTLLNHHDLFGNAQTANLIYLTMDLVGHNFHEVMLRVMNLGAFVLGLGCTVWIPRYTKWNLRLCSICIDIIAGIVICLIPSSVNDFVALCPVLFATAFQWNSFQKVDGYGSSTIFSTNNLRQFSTSLFAYFCDKENEHLRKAKAFGGTLLFYHLGVAISFVLYLTIGANAGWVCMIPSFVALTLLSLEREWIVTPIPSV